MPRLRLSLLLLLIPLSGCTPPPSPAAAAAAAGGVTEFQKIDEGSGTGIAAAPGDRVSVHYTGWLYDQRKPDRRGEVFDSSRKQGEPFVFTLGAGQVIRGWDEGVVGMKIGGKRTLMIPPAFGYGDRGAGGVIPPGASLVFDVELLDVQRRP